MRAPLEIYERIAIALRKALPKGLYARSLLIIIVPMVLLQSVIAYVFMERHYQLVTRRLSQAVTQDIAALIDLYAEMKSPDKAEALSRIAQERLNLEVDFLPLAPLPPPGPKPFFSILDQTLSEEISRMVKRPFWIDTVGRSSFVEIRVQLEHATMRVIARRSQTYASNSHIFIVWMVGASFVLLVVAIIFLRNQIRPILKLAEAAESFGKGREIAFRPRGAREVRNAGRAFLEMKMRIERAIEQRTAMLNGVSHDLRTILTRFKLSLALLPPTPETQELKRDTDEMGQMLEAYLAFARGDAGEASSPTDIRALLEELKLDAERQGHVTAIEISGDPTVVVRPTAFKRLLSNLVGNAARHGDRIAINAAHAGRWLTVTIDDDGPGIPADKRDDVFKPFYRLDESRNQDEGGSGLGLAIARDIARGHGGDIVLAESPLGGLRASVRVPA
ncbi:ATP-binding protein [Terrarubrum flagellatum]|uniref:ATP-binding protein n=1 Tax=Terrirubrum flagellatum TaxID=2895980 RepID=UPI0031454A5F